MPEQAEPVERADLVAAMAVGNEIVRLRRVAPRFVPGAAVDAALQALAEGRSGEAIERLKDIDRQFAALPRTRSGSRVRAWPPGRPPGGLRSTRLIRLLLRPTDPMRFNEINLFGLYVAPITVIMAVAWVAYVVVRRVGDRFGLTERVWHPALFELALYVIIVSSIVLMIARWSR